MNHDERNTQLLVEQACGPLDEILDIYKGGLCKTHQKKIAQCRALCEHILRDYAQRPDNPDRVVEEADD